MAEYSEEQLDRYREMLAERVFRTRQWPHFGQLLREIRDLARDLGPDRDVVSLERGLLYGGVSLVAPFFQRQRFVSVDCSPASADARGAYNAGLLDDPRALRVPTTHRAPIERTGLPADCADLVLVPNLVHHVADQAALFGEMARITRPGGAVYVYEPTLRELHQIPDDYLRYTPFGMAQILRQVGLEPEPHRAEGGPFSAIAYCWTQALQFLPEETRAGMERWFRDEHLPQLLKWDEEHPVNLVRGHTEFPVSFSILARKPASEASR